MTEMSVSQAMKARFSARAFLDKPVPEDVLTDLFDHAALAASGCNFQPWNVHVFTGQKKSELETAVMAKAPESPLGEGSDINIYPSNMSGVLRQRRIECGELLYSTLGIAREDKNARMQQTMQNFTFFGAPVGILFTARKGLGEIQYIDYGIFIQSVMLLAVERGLDTCAQAFWAMWPNTIRDHLGLEDDEVVACGMSLGYADPDHIVNSVDMPRVNISEFLTRHGD
ncbi:NADH dehydrogenase [Kordiimonas sediminis]|uniref:NADH dehydrogenase n=1 Tax=Kordiimonas sediminis TaxID=1735581 RepID=A0A919E769_9PROT|nr:nitroreductase [Kordiimonas sediminis]GHF20686.1 NADH dehydrogenase [Kordiimonas sediminis]